MASPKGTYLQSIERMQQSISRLDRQLQRSSQFLSHDITIDNRTKQDLNFIIKVQEEDQESLMNKSQSRVIIPHQSIFRHRISSTPRQRQPTDYSYSDDRNKEKPLYFKNVETSHFDEHLNQSYREYPMTPSTPKQVPTSIKFQRKFQPFNHLEQKQSSYEPVQSYTAKKHQLAESGVQTDDYSTLNKQGGLNPLEKPVPASKVSEKIQEQGSINYLPSYLKNEKSHQDNRLQHTDTINLPILLSEIKQNQHLTKQPYIQESPQVMNYLKQEYTNHHPQIYTPMHKTEEEKDMSITFSSLSNSKKTYQRKSREKQWSIEPLSLGYQNNKKYFEEVKERQMLNKLRQKTNQRKSRLKTESHHGMYKIATKNNERSGYIAHFELPSAKKDKADDLFLQRKSLFIKNLQQQKGKGKVNEKKTPVKTIDRSRSKDHTVSYQSLSTTNKKKPMDRSTQQLSPRIRDISQRLYSRSKEKLHPCDHYQRHSQSIQRERFYSIVHQNSFVQKYVSKEEQEQLFQKFRRQNESVSSWPMKILNYTYSKLQKINSSRYTIKKLYQ